MIFIRNVDGPLLPFFLSFLYLLQEAQKTISRPHPMRAPCRLGLPSATRGTGYYMEKDGGLSQGCVGSSNSESPPFFSHVVASGRAAEERRGDLVIFPMWAAPSSFLPLFPLLAPKKHTRRKPPTSPVHILVSSPQQRSSSLTQRTAGSLEAACAG